MIGISALILSVAYAGNTDPKVERLERLERALQIEDCQYAIEELEHLNVGYSNMPLRYALLAEGYLCVGKPEKARLAVAEFARLGGEANQLSLRVQEYCALQQCSVEPVLVTRVRQEEVNVEGEDASLPGRTSKSFDEADSVESVESTEGDIAPRLGPIQNEDRVVQNEDIVVQNEDGMVQSEGETDSVATSLTEVEDVRIEPPLTLNQNSVTSVEAVEEVDSLEEQEDRKEENNEKSLNEEPGDSNEEPSTLYSLSDINGLIVDGQCEDAASASANLIAVDGENPLAYMAFGDALSCFPEGSGDIFAAFDAWMIAKSLAKTQQMDWRPMKERLGWALERSGIVKIVPEFSDGHTEWPEGFEIELESSRPVDLASRTDHMLGGTYLTNLPEGPTTIRIQPGGARAEVVHTVDIQAGTLEKIRVPVGAETHVRLPSLPAPEGYTVTFVSQDGTPLLYLPQESRLLPKGAYSVTVDYNGQEYAFRLDTAALETQAAEASVDFDAVFRDALPWVYQIRQPTGALLNEGLVYPDQDAQEVSIPLAVASYEKWRVQYSGEEWDSNGDQSVDFTEIQLMAAGTLEKLDGSLFTEIVIEPTLHPFYETAERLYTLESERRTSIESNQWLTGTMALTGGWTVASLAMANRPDESDSGWERQAVIASMVTIPMVGIWMYEKIVSHPKQEGEVLSTRRLLESMNDHPIPFAELVPSAPFEDGAE